MVTNVKRLMGAKWSDDGIENAVKMIPAEVVGRDKNTPLIEVSGYLGEEKTLITPEEVSAAILT